MDKIQLELTPGQAQAVCDALDAYSRLCIGQLEEVADLARLGVVPMSQPHTDNERQLPSIEVCEQLDMLMMECKRALGHPRNGSLGIGHPHVHLSGRRAYEVKKVLAKVVAEHQNPIPDFRFRGINYDGLGPRYTNDPAPVAYIQTK